MREFVRPQPGVQINEQPAPPPTVEPALARLATISQRMRWYGLGILLATLNNFALALSLQVEKMPAARWAFLLPALLALVGVGVYEALRKEGDALFEEISDELEWEIRGRRFAETPMRDRPELAVRATLRIFARASDLPLIPGRFGPAIYAGLNLLCAGLATYLLFS